MKNYTITRVKNREDFETQLPHIEKVCLDSFAWPDVNKLEPISFAAVAYDDSALHVYLDSNEPVLRAEVTEQNGPVHTDSCLEFFFMPAPAKNQNYLNFEINPLGVFSLAVGKERFNRSLITDEDASYFGVKALKNLNEWNGKLWQISYSLPFTFLKKYIPEFEKGDLSSMKGNFYKCGDSLPNPHWASWNPIKTPKPDFHRPEFFAPIHI